MSTLTETDALAALGVMTSLMTAFGNIAGASRAQHEYERLARLSDAELARRGLRREELAALVAERHLR